MQGRGKFIMLEGGEGFGKMMMISRLGFYFEEQGIFYVVIWEFGGIEIVEKICVIIFDFFYMVMDVCIEVLFYVVVCSQYLVEKVELVLKEGKMVICDCFVDSSLVY